MAGVCGRWHGGGAVPSSGWVGIIMLWLGLRDPQHGCGHGGGCRRCLGARWWRGVRVAAQGYGRWEGYGRRGAQPAHQRTAHQHHRPSPALHTTPRHATAGKLLIECAGQVAARRQLPKGTVVGYEEIAEESFGKLGRLLISSIIYIELFGTCALLFILEVWVGYNLIRVFGLDLQNVI